MMRNIYTYKGKDITFKFIDKIADVCGLVSEKTNTKFQDVLYDFYDSKTHNYMLDTEGGYWLKSIDEIAEDFINEMNNKD